jgi:hypothetical protein
MNAAAAVLARIHRLAVLLMRLIGPVENVCALTETELSNGFNERLREFWHTEGGKAAFTTDDSVVIMPPMFGINIGAWSRSPAYDVSGGLNYL